MPQRSATRQGHVDVDPGRAQLAHLPQGPFPACVRLDQMENPDRAPPAQGKGNTLGVPYGYSK